MNRYVLEPDKAWRSGVFLHRENSNAFVQETYGSKEIIIRAEGTHAKELMTLIVEDFDTMHNTYGQKLNVKKWIPCICDTCIDLDTPNFYNFINLRTRQEKGKKTVECDISFDDVDVYSLLSGLFTIRAYQELNYIDLKRAKKEIKAKGLIVSNKENFDHSFLINSLNKIEIQLFETNDFYNFEDLDFVIYDISNFSDNSEIEKLKIPHNLNEIGICEKSVFTKKKNDSFYSLLITEYSKSNIRNLIEIIKERLKMLGINGDL